MSEDTYYERRALYGCCYSISEKFLKIFTGVVPGPVRLVYFLLSMSQELPIAAITYVLNKELEVTPEQLTLYYTLCYFPWTLKSIYAFISDQVPIFGYRRKPYIFLSSICSCVVFICLGFFAKNYQVFRALGITNSILVCIGEVMVDGVTVELGNRLTNEAKKLKEEAREGNVNEAELSHTEQRLLISDTPRALVQSEAMAVRSFASVVAAAISLLILLFLSPRMVIILTAGVPIITATVAWFMHEDKHVRVFATAITEEGELENAENETDSENIAINKNRIQSDEYDEHDGAKGAYIGEGMYITNDNPASHSKLTERDTLLNTDSSNTLPLSYTEDIDDLNPDVENVVYLQHSKKHKSIQKPRNCCSLMYFEFKTRIMLVLRALLILIRPALFVFLSHCIPTSTDAYYSFIYSEEYDYPAWMYSGFTFISLTGSLLGSILYWKYFSSYKIKRVFIVTTLIDIVAALPVVALTAQLNRKWGIPDLVYIPIVSFIDAVFGRVSLMPSIVLAAECSPSNVGLEATMFSAFTSVSNLGTNVSSVVTIATMRLFKIKYGEFQNLPYFMIMCLGCQLIPIMLLPLLPSKEEDYRPSMKLSEDGELTADEQIETLVA